MFSQPPLALPDTGGRRLRPAAAEPIRAGMLRFAAFELAVWASCTPRTSRSGAPRSAAPPRRSTTAATSSLSSRRSASSTRPRSSMHCPALERLFSAYYMAGFAPLIVTTLLWLGFRHPQHYRELRTALLISISVAVVFVLFPAAPPRLIPDLGIIDTVGLSDHDTGSFAGIRFNPYAAMPSMHVGWSLLVGLVGYRAAGDGSSGCSSPLHPAVMVRRGDGDRKPFRTRRDRGSSYRLGRGGPRLRAPPASLEPFLQPSLLVHQNRLTAAPARPRRCTTSRSRGRRPQNL